MELGIEGPTDDAFIEELRNRKVKNFLTATLRSLGLPMFVMGDEVRRTQFLYPLNTLIYIGL